MITAYARRYEAVECERSSDAVQLTRDDQVGDDVCRNRGQQHAIAIVAGGEHQAIQITATQDRRIVRVPGRQPTEVSANAYSAVIGITVRPSRSSS